MAILRLVLVLCALRLAKPLERELSPIENELRLVKRQEGIIGDITISETVSGVYRAFVNCTAQFSCQAVNAESVTWTLSGVGSLPLPESPGRSVVVTQVSESTTVATLILDPVIPEHEEFYVCQVQGGNTAAVNIFLEVIDEPLSLEANTPMADISNATEGTNLTILCTTNTCLEGVMVQFYMEGTAGDDTFLHENFGINGTQTFAYNHMITLNSMGNYYCEAVHFNNATGMTIRSDRQYFTITGTPMQPATDPMATTATDGSSDPTSQSPTDGTTATGMGSTNDTPGDGTSSPLFQSALSLTLLLVTLVAVLMS